MILVITLILIVAIALPSISLCIRNILYARIASIIFICIALLVSVYIQSIGSDTGVYSGLFQVTTISQILDHINHLSSTEIYILKKVILFCVWFVIGVYSYLKVIPSSLKGIINKLTLLELFVVLYTFFFLFNFISLLIVNYFFIPDFSIYSFITGNGQTGNNNLIKNTIDKAGDTAIMTASVAAAAKLAAQMPNPLAKAAFLAGGVVIGGGAIIVKNISGEISSPKNKYNFEETVIDLFNNYIYTLTGNNAIDLLNLIQIFQKGGLLYIILICYFFFVFKINTTLVETILIKVFPKILVQYYIKSLNLLKKSALLLLVCSFILLVVCNLYSYYYLQFFIDNLDKIIELYLKK